MNQDHERDRTVVAGAFATPDTAQEALSALRADGYADDQLGWLLQGGSATTDAAAGGILGDILAGAPRASLHDALLSLDMSPNEAGDLDKQVRRGQSVVLVRAGARYLEAGNVLERYGAYQGEDVRAAAYATNPASAALNEMVQVAGARASERLTPSTANDGTPEPVTYRRAGSIDERGAADVAVVGPDGGATAPDQDPTSPGTSDLVPNPAPAASTPRGAMEGAGQTGAIAPGAAGDNHGMRRVAKGDDLTAGSTALPADPAATDTTSTVRSAMAPPPAASGTAATRSSMALPPAASEQGHGGSAVEGSSVVISSSRRGTDTVRETVDETRVGGTGATSHTTTGETLADTAPMPTSAAQPMMAEMQAQRAVEDVTPREPAQRPRDDSGDVAEGTKQTHVGTISNTETGA